MIDFFKFQILGLKIVINPMINSFTLKNFALEN